jgi:predicted patatin/cPLA2 family phospholipase
MRQFRRAARLVPPHVLQGSEDVLRAIVARKRRLDAGLGRDDGLRLGIIAEGGAMRGVVSGGACVGLEDLGLTEVFDVAYGASAGAINLAYFVIGEAGRASRIYAEHAARPEFVNPLRLRKILDLDFLFDKVIRTDFPIPKERLLASPTELRVSVTEKTTGRNALLSVREPSIDPYDLLKASAAVPFYYGRTVPLLGSEWLDGMASNALPVKEALADGCTHVLLLLSARPGEGSAREASPGSHDIAWAERVLFLPRHASGFRRSYVTRRRRLRTQLHLAHEDARVHALHPSPHCPVPSRISRDRVALERACEHARRRVHELFAPWGLGP